MLQPLPDNELMDRIRQGDAQAFRLLVQQHLPRAHAVARRMLYSHQDAEEAAQDAFTKVWVNACRFDATRASFGTWFYRILTRTCLDLLRRRPPLHEDISGMEETLEASAQDDQERMLIAQREAAKVRRAVLQLPENQRLAVVLCYFEGMTNPQAAEVMGLHVKALEGLLARARRKLKDVLGNL